MTEIPREAEPETSSEQADAEPRAAEKTRDNSNAADDAVNRATIEPPD